MQDFHKVEVWKKAHHLTLQAYRITEKFPREEAFGLAVQVRRAAATIAMKIAEGCGKDSNIEFAVCLQQGRGTAVDLEYLLLLSRDLRFMESRSVHGKPIHDELLRQLIEIRKMLSGFMKTLAGAAI
jgi:four helix bundle protein